jgi:hypothetical protein
LIALAMMVNDEDPDFSSLALEVARPLLSQVEPIESRAMTLQSLISAYQEVEGEVDADLVRDGFALADQLREKTEKAGEPQDGMENIETEDMPTMTAEEIDQLEAGLTSALAKDNYDKAVDYARSRKSEAHKLECLIQIVQALSGLNSEFYGRQEASE